MNPLAWMNAGTSAGSGSNTTTASSSGTHNGGDYEERNRVSSYRGYLYKLRRSQNLLAPQWGKRWFTIEGHFLKWYRTETDLCSSGMVDLKYVRSILKLENSAYGNYAFLVTCEERNLILRCANMNDMNNWIRALHIQADIARGGSGMNVVSDFNQLPFQATMSSTLKNASRKNGKLRASMTLQQELDLNLKKLDELEKELRESSITSSSIKHGQRDDSNSSRNRGDGSGGSDNERKQRNGRRNRRESTPSPKSSPRRYEMAPQNSGDSNVSSGGNYNNNESAYSLNEEAYENLPIRSPHRSSGVGSASTTSSTAAASTSTAGDRAKSGKTQQLDRLESIEDIQLISPTTPANRSKQALKSQRQQQQQKSMLAASSSDIESPTIDQIRYRGSATPATTNTTVARLGPVNQNSVEDLSDEFEYDSDSREKEKEREREREREREKERDREREKEKERERRERDRERDKERSTREKDKERSSRRSSTDRDREKDREKDRESRDREKEKDKERRSSRKPVEPKQNLDFEEEEVVVEAVKRRKDTDVSSSRDRERDRERDGHREKDRERDRDRERREREREKERGEDSVRSSRSSVRKSAWTDN